MGERCRPGFILARSITSSTFPHPCCTFAPTRSCGRNPRCGKWTVLSATARHGDVEAVVQQVERLRQLTWHGFPQASGPIGAPLCEGTPPSEIDQGTGVRCLILIAVVIPVLIPSIILDFVIDILPTPGR